MTALLLLFIIGGFLLAAFALPPMLRLVRPGSLYGVGFGASAHNPAIWYEINQGAGYRMFKAGVLTIAAALILYLIPGVSAAGYYLSCSIVLIGLFVNGLVKTAGQLRQHGCL